MKLNNAILAIIYSINILDPALVITKAIIPSFRQSFLPKDLLSTHHQLNLQEQTLLRSII